MLEWMATAGARSGGGGADSPSVWVVTSAARYRLLAPAAAYEDSFARTLRRMAPEGRNAKAAAAADAMLAEGAGDMSAVGVSTPRFVAPGFRLQMSLDMQHATLRLCVHFCIHPTGRGHFGLAAVLTGRTLTLLILFGGA